MKIVAGHRVTMKTLTSGRCCNLLLSEDLTWMLMFYWIYQTSWGKEIKCEACRAFYPFFTTSLINSLIQEHEC